jgi:hypothetical protein
MNIQEKLQIMNTDYESAMAMKNYSMARKILDKIRRLEDEMNVSGNQETQSLISTQNNQDIPTTTPESLTTPSFVSDMDEYDKTQAQSLEQINEEGTTIKPAPLPTFDMYKGKTLPQQMEIYDNYQTYVDTMTKAKEAGLPTPKYSPTTDAPKGAEQKFGRNPLGQPTIEGIIVPQPTGLSETILSTFFLLPNVRAKLGEKGGYLETLDDKIVGGVWNAAVNTASFLVTLYDLVGSQFSDEDDGSDENLAEDFRNYMGQLPASVPTDIVNLATGFIGGNKVYEGMLNSAIKVMGKNPTKIGKFGKFISGELGMGASINPEMTTLIVGDKAMFKTLQNSDLGLFPLLKGVPVNPEDPAYKQEIARRINFVVDSMGVGKVAEGVVGSVVFASKLFYTLTAGGVVRSVFGKNSAEDRAIALIQDKIRQATAPGTSAEEVRALQKEFVELVKENKEMVMSIGDETFNAHATLVQTLNQALKNNDSKNAKLALQALNNFEKGLIANKDVSRTQNQAVETINSIKNALDKQIDPKLTEEGLETITEKAQAPVLDFGKDIASDEQTLQNIRASFVDLFQKNSPELFDELRNVLQKNPGAFDLQVLRNKNAEEVFQIVKTNAKNSADRVNDMFNAIEGGAIDNKKLANMLIGMSRDTQAPKQIITKITDLFGKNDPFYNVFRSLDKDVVAQRLGKPPNKVTEKEFQEFVAKEIEKATFNRVKTILNKDAVKPSTLAFLRKADAMNMGPAWDETVMAGYTDKLRKILAEEGMPNFDSVEDSLYALKKKATKKTIKQESGTTFADLFTIIRPRIEEKIKQLGKSGDPDTIAIRDALIKFKSYITKDATEFASSDQAKAAFNYYRNTHAPLFLNGGVLEDILVSARNPYHKVADEVDVAIVGEDTLRAGVTQVTDENINQATNIIKVLGEDNKGKLGNLFLQDSLLEVSNLLASGKTLRELSDPEQIQGLLTNLRSKASILQKDFPQQFEQINNLANDIAKGGQEQTVLLNRVEELRKVLDVAETELYKEGPLRTFFRNQKPISDKYESFQALLNAKNNSEDVAKLVELAEQSGDPSVLKGLQAGYLDNFKAAIFNTTPEIGTTVSVSLARIMKNIDKEILLAGSFFRNRPEVVDGLIKVADFLEIDTQLKRAKGIVSDSSTADRIEMRKAVDRGVTYFFGVLTRSGAIVRNILGSGIDKVTNEHKALILMDSIMSDPDYFIELSERYFKNTQPSANAETVKDFVKFLTKGTYVTSGSEEELKVKREDFAETILSSILDFTRTSSDTISQTNELLRDVTEEISPFISP